nr:unnamed protein product [Callosobruchus chinensis]
MIKTSISQAIEDKSRKDSSRQFATPLLRVADQILPRTRSQSEASSSSKRKAISPADGSEFSDESLASSQTDDPETKRNKRGWKKGRPRKVNTVSQSQPEQPATSEQILLTNQPNSLSQPEMLEFGNVIK